MSDTYSMPFQLQRYFSIAALIGYLLAVILLALFYRHLAINDIAITGESSNLMIAQTAFNAVKDELANYLDSTMENENNNEKLNPIPFVRLYYAGFDRQYHALALSSS